jgi:hypothetical protein
MHTRLLIKLKPSLRLLSLSVTVHFSGHELDLHSISMHHCFSQTRYHKPMPVKTLNQEGSVNSQYKFEFSLVVHFKSLMAKLIFTFEAAY